MDINVRLYLSFSGEIAAESAKIEKIAQFRLFVSFIDWSLDVAIICRLNNIYYPTFY